ncbi:hypothetical protein JCM5350_000478 [Sporobolomyces pararoseus]
MSQDAKRDFLSSLPPELLSEIFNYAYKDFEPPRAPISRALLPFQRQALFRKIRIDALSHFDSLVEAHESNAGLGRMVKSLEVQNVDTQGGGGGTKNERRMKGFFSTLVNLEQLRLGSNTTSLIDLVLSLRIARSELPQLRSLVLEIPSEWKKPFDSKIYRNLNEYPSLCRLEISTEKHDRFACNSRGGGKLTKITQLVLKGPEVDNSKTLSFLQNFPNLKSLTLDTLASHHPDYSSLVGILPTSLISLTLRNLGFYDGYSKPCDQHFPRLVNLESLYLSEGTFTKDLINPLLQLPKLQTLGFGKGAVLEPSRIEEMVVGPHRLPALEKLIFDQFEGKVGWSISKDSDGVTLHSEHMKDFDHLGPGWQIPRADTCMSGRDFDDLLLPLLSTIKEAKIQIEGKTLDALKVWDKWRYEVVMCEFAYAAEVGNCDEMLERYGEDYVKEFKANYGWDDEFDEFSGYYDY